MTEVKMKIRSILGVEKRLDLLEASLLMEHLTSAWLITLLGIQEWKNSKLFGNKSGNLSFNQKIELLIEIGALSKDHKNKFVAFMEIRNQFMHNYEAESYEKLFSFNKDTERFILRTYKQPTDISLEEQLEGGVKQLIKETKDITLSLIGSVTDSISKKAEGEVYKKFQQSHTDAIKELENLLNEYAEKELSKNPTVDTKRLKGMGTEIVNIFKGLIIKNYDRIDSESKKTL
jgi:hypothetical protein